ncbi:MAG: polyphosphate:AMP phosphotransferase [Gemmatimonadetes bacterium]|nr:polyphosphate:AMP phosphotransferase [Gemmatimonadota bacterium]
MFETAELNRKISKEVYDAEEPKLRTALLEAQERLKGAKFSVIVVIGGVDGAGKGETINALHEWMDARYFDTHAFAAPSDEERERPPSWRFWRVLPAKGRVGIFFGSWYTDPILNRVFGETGKGAFEAALQRINGFEKMLVDDGTLLVKWWFHLSEKAQAKRLKSLEKDPATSWRVTKADWKHFKMYDKFRRVSERALRETSTGEAPWFVIEGVDHRYRTLTAGRDLLERLAARLDAGPKPPPTPPPRVQGDPKTILDTLDLSKKLSDNKYDRELERSQGRLNLLWRRVKADGRSAVLVFEGWDAAGKGGAIRRITPALDARDYHVISVAAPTDEEKARHYLWRFWRHLARAGRFTIFDRSWYGRVLVERVEGFAREEEWRRAYNEINQFEEQLTEHGIALIKYWLHIDADEQLRRFQGREQIAFKKYKITHEDYRNREKMHDYELAANEMIERSNTEDAPWVLVEANDKRHARIKILKTLCDRLEKTL